MAALIAQISLAARERKVNKIKMQKFNMASRIFCQRRELEVPTVDIQRSVYKLPR